MRVKLKFEILEQLGDELGDVDIRPAYSGRGMYGKPCVGVVLGNDTSSLIELGWTIARLGAEGVLSEDTEQALLRGAQLDTMGHGVIVYWPGIECADAPEEWEDQ